MKALKITGIILLIVILLVILLGIIAPDEFGVERSVQINAPVTDVYEEVRYFENFEYWSPWAQRDPEMQTYIEGEDGNVGAVYHWEGNEDVGKGKQEIVEVSSNRIDIKLTFLEPWESEADTYLIFDEEDNATVLTWGFNSSFDFPFNIFGLFFNMEDAIGKDYDNGLENLKERIERKHMLN